MKTYSLILVLFLSACSTTTDLRGIQTGCEFDAKYKGSGTFKLTCDNELTKDTNAETQGTVSGPDIGQ